MSRPSVIGIDLNAAIFTMPIIEVKVSTVYLDCLLNWGAMPGTRARPGITGRFDVGANPITLRMRVGLDADHNQPLGGTVVAEVILPANTITDLGMLGDEFAYPTVNGGVSRAMLTGQAVGGTSSFSATAASMTFTPADSAARAVVLNSGVPQLYAAPAWLLDFDVFAGAAELVVGVAYRIHNLSTTHRVFLGGTMGSVPAPGYLTPAADGVLALTTISTGIRPGAIATVANTLAGPQWAKFVIGDSPGDGTVIIREA